MKKPSLKISGVSSWYKSQKQKRKEKEEQERNLEPSSLKDVYFSITACLQWRLECRSADFSSATTNFPAVLVAFITFKIPRLGMPIGGVIIGLGLMYHLADIVLYFFSRRFPNTGSIYCYLDGAVCCCASNFQPLQKCPCH